LAANPLGRYPEHLYGSANRKRGLNLTDRRAGLSRDAQIELVLEGPDRVVAELAQDEFESAERREPQRSRNLAGH
jgi:hypothetical protein